MAVWLLSRFVAMCVETCGLDTWCCKTHCNGCSKIPRCCGCLRNTIVFCSWESWIVFEWLHQGCNSDLSADFLNFAASDFPLEIPFKKCLKIVLFFFALAPRSGFRAANSDVVARSSIVICSSVSADCIVMAASRLLGAAAACVILLSFAAGHRKSYWNGCASRLH